MLVVRTFLTSKEGEEFDDCQDSIHPFPTAAEDIDQQVFAVSDGTTTSFFSRVWSAALTRHFAENPEQAFSDWDTWLGNAQKKWEAEVGERARANDASFFTRNGFHARRPAAATFAALVVGQTSENRRSWRALVLGDSCLFFLRADGQPRVMNLQTSAEFSSVVRTVESWPKNEPHRPTAYESSPTGIEPPILEHDAVLLASDALSKWMILRHERGRPVWGSVLGLENDSEFAKLVASARAEAEDPLENDDVALAVLQFGELHPVYREQRFEPNRAPEPAPLMSVAPLVAAPPSQAEKEPTKLAATGDTPASFYPVSRLAPPKPRRRFWRFAVLLALTTLALAGVYWLAVSRNRALEEARISEKNRLRLSVALKSATDEKAMVTALAERHQSEMQAALRQRDAAERLAQEDAKVLRQSQDQLKILEILQKADRRKISELEQQVAALKEQLAKSSQPANLGEVPSPTLK